MRADSSRYIRPMSFRRPAVVHLVFVVAMVLLGCSGSDGEIVAAPTSSSAQDERAEVEGEPDEEADETGEHDDAPASPPDSEPEPAEASAQSSDESAGTRAQDRPTGIEPGPAQAIAEQIGQPTAASVTEFESSLSFDRDASISPSGRAIATPVDGQWCLSDSSGITCVDALAEGSAAHGVVWRPDERAIAVTWGAQNPMSIIDFNQGTSVETSLGKHRLLAYTADGTSIVGLDIDIPGQISFIDPLTLEATRFADSFEGGVPQIYGAIDELYWGALPGEPAVFTITEGASPEFVLGGLGEQLLVSVTSDGRLALGMDDEVDRGRPGPDDTLFTIFDRAGSRSVGIVLPPDIDQRAPKAGQLSADGRTLLVLHDADSGMALSSAAIDPETLEASGWTVLTNWESGDPLMPPPYQPNTLLRWDGGATAWILGDGFLLEITLS